MIFPVAVIFTRLATDFLVLIGFGRRIFDPFSFKKNANYNNAHTVIKREFLIFLLLLATVARPGFSGPLRCAADFALWTGRFVSGVLARAVGLTVTGFRGNADTGCRAGSTEIVCPRR